MGVVVVAAALALGWAQPAAAACGGVKQSGPTRDRVPGNYRPPLAIGDSVMLGAVDEMAHAPPTKDRWETSEVFPLLSGGFGRAAGGG